MRRTCAVHRVLEPWLRHCIANKHQGIGRSSGLLSAKLLTQYHYCPLEHWASGAVPVATPPEPPAGVASVGPDPGPRLRSERDVNLTPKRLPAAVGQLWRH
jgi:hypothetical protein